MEDSVYLSGYTAPLVGDDFFSELIDELEYGRILVLADTVM